MILAFHNINAEDENQDLLKRSINKCIKHLENLSNNWRKVFSPHVYFKVIGNFQIFHQFSFYFFVLLK
jgi:hypothetical protein